MNKRKIIIAIIFAIIVIVGALIYQIYTAISRSRLPPPLTTRKSLSKTKKLRPSMPPKTVPITCRQAIIQSRPPKTASAAARQRLTPPPNHGILSLSSSCRNQIRLASGKKNTWINIIRLKVLLASKSAKLAKNSPKNIQ